jgi:Ion channel
MLVALLVTITLVALTTVIHFEVLSALNHHLPGLRIRSRSKLLVVLFATFLAHCVEIAIYGGALYAMLAWWGLGGLTGAVEMSLLTCMFLSAEAYTSIGFGPVVPTGPTRLLFGAEALNGLLLIGWSASYAFIAMERYWVPKGARRAT